MNLNYTKRSMITIKILITGTDGFIGNYLKKHLENRGYSIFGTVFRRSPGKNEIKFDVRLIDSLQGLKNQNYDIIINTIGIVDQNQPKKLMFEVNFRGTKRLVDWSRNMKCKHFIQISSVAVYGLKSIGENRSEQSTKRYEGYFAIPYMRSKAKAEKYIESSGIPYTILRLPAVLGRNDTILSSSLITKLLKGNFYFSGKKDKIFSTLYIQNLGSLIENVLEIGPKNDYFNCTDYHTKWSKFINEYIKNLSIKTNLTTKSIFSILTNLKDKDYLLMISFSKFGAHFPNEKIKRVFNWNPEYPWEKGVSDAIESHKTYESIKKE